jgi:hypothetical protein
VGEDRLLHDSFIPDSHHLFGGSGETWVYALDYQDRAAARPTRSSTSNGDKPVHRQADKVVVNGQFGRARSASASAAARARTPCCFKDTLFVTTSMTEPAVNNPGGESVTGLNAIKVNIPQAKVRVESWKHN